MFYCFKEYRDEFGRPVTIRFGVPTTVLKTVKSQLKKAGVGEVRDEKNRIIAVRIHGDERWVRDFQ